VSDDSADRDSIVSLIHRDRVAFWLRDADTWADCFVQEPHLVRWGWSRIGGAYYQRGWEEVWSRLRKEFAELPEPNPHLAHDTTIENLQFHFAGEVAWLSFDQQYPGGHLYRGLEPGRTHEFRVFERRAGSWKIAVSGLVDTLRSQTRLMLRLSPDGRIEWMAPAAKTALEADDDLVIRGGRLRVRNARSDRKLQAAIRWAATIDSTYMSRRAAVPVIIEAGEGLPTRVWWVMAEDGSIHFSLGDVDRTGERMQIAALVFGLSPAQQRVAELVSEGLTLGDIATRLGVSLTTVRTHLNRVFAKTGVRTQPALMRVLLMAAAPA
jgi:DNA-binding CsgD family transcriptional regulator